jgi:peptidoglycan/xylan/chitin deacetylase (PgdA/CDA1 family)
MSKDEHHTVQGGQMGTILIGYDTEAAAIGEGLARFNAPPYHTALDPATTRRALEIITEAHRAYAVPATLFVCGRTLLHALDALIAARHSGLFDIQQHTYSHLLFRDVVYHAPESSFTIHASPLEALTEEVAFTSQLLERYLGSRPIGIRTPYGYYQGLRGRPEHLGMLHAQGIRYVSSWGRGEGDTIPSPWRAPFFYAEEGYPDMLEIPFPFWYDSGWFDQYGWENGVGYGEALKGAVDAVAEHDYVYGVCFHEWVPVAAHAEQTRYLHTFLEYARRRNVECLSYSDYYRRRAGLAGPAS